MRAQAVLITMLTALASISVNAQSPELLQRVPTSTNALILWNVERVLSSKMSQDAGWEEKYGKAYATGLATVPPNAKFAIVASEIDLQKWSSIWTLAAFDLTTNVNLAGIAKHYEGILDEIGGVKTVGLSKDAYVLQFGTQQVAAYAPGNRQAIARWIRETQSPHEVSPYLQNAISRSKVSDIVQAFDLTDAIPAKVIDAKVARALRWWVGPRQRLIVSPAWYEHS